MTLAPWLLATASILMMLRFRDFKMRSGPCVVCGRRGQHSIGCPGRG